MNIFSSLFKNTKKGTLTDKEISLCEIIEYDQQWALAIKEITKSEIELLPEVDENAQIQETKDEGLCSKVDYRTAFDYIVRSKTTFKSKGYLLFFFQDENKNVFLSLMKGSNETDIVKWRQTYAGNFSLDTNNIVDKLNEWQSICQFEILGVGDDFIEIKFVQLPDDVNKFAEDIYNFCPDTVDQGTGEIELLQEELVKTRLLQLWWD